MTKKIKIIIAIIAILFIAFLGTHYFMFEYPKIGIAKKCQGFVPTWTDFIDCYGIVSINDGWDMDYISLKDHIHKYEIARVYNQNQYIYINNKIFVINLKNIENSASDGFNTTYYQKLFQGGNLIENEYDSISNIPNYLVIDTENGEVKTYKNIDEVPNSEKKYFEDIKNK
jgi:hypothetical protein